MLRATLCALLLQLFLHSSSSPPPSSALCDRCHCTEEEIRCDSVPLQHPLIKGHVRNASKIEKIKIVNCTLTEPEIDDTDFQECFTLTLLFISDISITRVSELALRDLRNLVLLVIDNAGLKNIPKRLFESNTRLETVRLTRNNIETFSPGTFPVNLTELDLSGNNIKIVDFQVFASRKLILWLLDNPIENVNNHTTFPKELHLDSQVDLYHNRVFLEQQLKSNIRVHFRCNPKYDIVTYVHSRRNDLNDAHEHSDLDEPYRQQCLDVCTGKLGKICDVPCPLVCDQEHPSTDAVSKNGETFSTTISVTESSSCSNEDTVNQTDQCSCKWRTGFAVLLSILLVETVMVFIWAKYPESFSKLINIMRCRNNSITGEAEEELDISKIITKFPKDKKKIEEQAELLVERCSKGLDESSMQHGEDQHS